MLKYLLAVCLLATVTSARAAELGGVTFPDTQDVAGRHLVLNGLALRTYSILRVQIYVAGLYLEQRSENAETILGSDGVKLVRFVFARDIDAEDARKSWQESFDRHCQVPCNVSRADMARFLATVPPARQGDVGTLVFSRAGLDLTTGGRFVGRVTDPNFARMILATFIGPRTMVPTVRAGLLGSRP